jgi:MoaA/NifB/PqqE/SkfB family radical SAM enzyme
MEQWGTGMAETFILSEYMNEAVERIVNDAIRASLQNPRETAFLLGYLLTSKKAKAKRMKYQENGEHIPPFIIGSISSKCNLFCKGCYSRENKVCGEDILENQQLSCERWDEIFKEAKQIGISFILLAGGEPFMRRDVIEKAAGFKHIIFPVFTNGTMFDKSYIALFNENRNLVPILSIEGNEEQTDQRRGEGTYTTLINVMENLNSKGILYGTSITVTTENIKTVTSEDFAKILYSKGCKILFYVEYVPVTSETKHLAPTEIDRELLRNKLSSMREEYNNMIFLSFPGDEKATGGCLAAGRGFFHINANGGAEPCPFSPYSDTNLKECSLFDALKSPLFKHLNQEGILVGEHSGGCLLFEKQGYVSSLIK